MSRQYFEKNILNEIPISRFVEIYRRCDTYNELANALGRKKGQFTKQLKDYAESLSLTPYRQFRLEDASYIEAYQRYDKNKANVRRYIRKHARKVFMNSDVVKKCICCGNERFDVAHIKAVKDFDKYDLIKDINHVKNLIPLCKNTHDLFDNVFTSREQNKLIKKYYKLNKL